MFAMRDPAILSQKHLDIRSSLTPADIALARHPLDGQCLRHRAPEFSEVVHPLLHTRQHLPVSLSERILRQQHEVAMQLPTRGQVG